MRRAISLIGLFGLLLTFVPVPAQQVVQSKRIPDSQDDIIRVDTSLVTLPVRVNDRRGKVVFGLEREQFRVFENGVEQEIVYFESPDVTSDAEANIKPLTVALMLDVSDSTEFKLTKIKAAALTFVDLLRDRDRVLLIVFDKQVQVLTEATGDRDALRRMIKSIQTGGGTSLYDALNEVISQRLAKIAGRKAIVLLTDGVDTTSKVLSFDSTIRAAETSDVTIYPVQYHTYSDFSDNPSRETYASGTFGALGHVTRRGEFASEAYKRATLYLRLLADKTAGHFQFADSAKNLAGSFETVARQLREQYTIGYYPKNKTDLERRIEVRVNEPKITVRTRQRYVYRHAPTAPLK